MKKRVLVAEDHADIRGAVSLTLSMAFGADVAEAADGAQAVRLYDESRRRGGRFAALVLDAAMPKMTGFQVAEYVRGLGDELPIVIITAYAEPLVIPHAKYVRATDVIYKPFTADYLARRVGEILEGDTAHSEMGVAR